MTEMQSGYEHPARTHDHHALNAFVGRWRVDGALGDGTHVTGVETYEWLAGGFFLVNRWDREMGSTRHTGIGVVGTDPEGGGMVTRAFDNLGFARAYRTEVRDGVMTLTGERERATISVRDGGDALVIHWERSEDGETWLPLCDLAGTRA